MKHTGRLPSVLLALCLALGVAAWSAQGARAEASGVDYVGEDGRTYNTVTDGIAGNDAPTPITGSEPGELPAGWYVVDGDVTRTGSRLIFNANNANDVYIILADGCTLTAPGIHCKGSLTIYGQAGGTGTIVSDCSGNFGVNVNKSLTIHGGAITAMSSSDYGICCGSFCMTGGRVTVQGDTGGINSDSGSGTAKIGFRTADDFLSLKTRDYTVLSGFTGVTIAGGQVMTDGTNVYTGTLTNEQIEQLDGKTLQLCEARIVDGDYYPTVQAALNAATGGQTVTLLRDVTTGAALTVGSDVNATLDLNGYTINRGLADKDSADNGSVITVSGTLTLTDSSQDKTGTITGGKTAYDGGGVYVDEYGTFRMSGGTISGNAANYGGGVYVHKTAAGFTMEGGTISDNTANIYGGGVYVQDGGTFRMSGGTISGNNADTAGGGVHVKYNGAFTMETGTISGNTAGEGGGVCVDRDSAFTMEGGTISGNTAGDGGGVYVETSGRFAMSGDAVISDNSASNGGGVYVYTNAAGFTMIGGTISGNTAQYGGGVYLDSFLGFEMTGGVITGNNADEDGGGVDCHYCSITVGGSADISGNVKGGEKGKNGVYTGGTASNARLETNSDGSVKPIIVKSPLTGGGAYIGVTMPPNFAAGVFTSGWKKYMSGKDPADFFKSDDARYVFMRNDGGEAELRLLTVTVKNGKADKTTAVEGATVKVTANEPETGKVFDKWTSGDGVTFADAYSAATTFTMPAKAVTVTATYHDYSLANGKVYAPKGAVLICAAYSGGRMTGMQSVTIGADCADKAPSSLGLTVPASGYQLMLVDGATYAPLCEAFRG